MSYRLDVPPRVRKELDQYRGKPFDQLSEAIGKLPDNTRPHGCVKLTASPEWRIRVGEYRIKYLIDDDGQKVSVTKVGHRSKVY